MSTEYFAWYLSSVKWKCCWSVSLQYLTINPCWSSQAHFNSRKSYQWSTEHSFSYLMLSTTWNPSNSTSVQTWKYFICRPLPLSEAIMYLDTQSCQNPVASREGTTHTAPSRKPGFLILLAQMTWTSGLGAFATLTSQISWLWVFQADPSALICSFCVGTQSWGRGCRQQAVTGRALSPLRFLFARAISSLSVSGDSSASPLMSY